MWYWVRRRASDFREGGRAAVYLVCGTRIVRADHDDLPGPREGGRRTAHDLANVVVVVETE